MSERTVVALERARDQVAPDEYDAMLRMASKQETDDYLNGYRSFPGSVETDQGLLVRVS